MPAPSTLFAIGGAGTLDALDPASGRVQWSVHIGGQPAGGQPGALLDAVSQGILYVTTVESDSLTLNLPTVGHVNAIDLQTHKILWTTHLAVAFLAVQDGVVYVSDATGIAALDSLTDHRAWHFGEPQPYPLSFGVGADGVAYLSYSQDAAHGVVDAIRLSDGSRIWQSALQGLALDALALDNGVVYTTARGPQLALAVEAFDAATGQHRWSATSSGASVDIQVADGHLFVHTLGTDVSGGLVALSAQSGQRQSGFSNHSQPGACVFNPPLLTDTAVYVPCGTPGHFLYAYQASSGAFLWQKGVAGDYIAVAGAEGNAVYAVGSYNGSRNTTTTACAATSGSILWQHPGAYAAATDTTAYISNGGALYAINAATGAVLWQNTTLGAYIQALTA